MKIKNILQEYAGILIGWVFMLIATAFLLFLYNAPLELVITLFWISFPFLIVLLAYLCHRQNVMNANLRAENFSSALYSPGMKVALEKLSSKQKQLAEICLQNKKEKKELKDYFSLWVHQIKLPLSAMALMLESDNLNRHQIQDQHRRIEQAVSMCMTYIRLDASDYRFAEYDLCELLKPVIRVQASTFISRHISLEFEQKQMPIITDEKWTIFLAEQLLSNALKYSPDHATITIRFEDQTLIIEDEGPGILPSDLPRIYDKGFTGKNGRDHNSVSSGLGLYLCNRICKNMNCILTVENRQEGGCRASVKFQNFSPTFDQLSHM